VVLGNIGCVDDEVGLYFVRCEFLGCEKIGNEAEKCPNREIAVTTY
jgi:hypothetical protein